MMLDFLSIFSRETINQNLDYILPLLFFVMYLAFGGLVFLKAWFDRAATVTRLEKLDPEAKRILKAKGMGNGRFYSNEEVSNAKSQAISCLQKVARTEKEKQLLTMHKNF
jgi:hypothetical protein